MAEEKILSIWFFVGLMLTILGTIITGTGLYYLFAPQSATVLHQLNPNLWWGLIMLGAGLAFLIPTYRQYRSEPS